MSSKVTNVAELETAKRYRVIFRGTGRKKDQVTTVQYLGTGKSGAVLVFSGRPDFGTMEIPRSAFISATLTKEKVSVPKTVKEESSEDESKASEA